MKRSKLLALAVLLMVLLSSCGSAAMENAQFGEIRTEFNESLDISEPEFLSPDGNSSEPILLELENASLSGSARVVEDNELSGSAGIFVGADADTAEISFSAASSGFYDITVTIRSDDDGRTNALALDGERIGSLVSSGAGKEDILISSIYIEEGEHTLSIVSEWGWMEYDCVMIMPSTVDFSDIYNVTCGLSNENADDNTKRLYAFLCDIYGKYTLTGQFADKGRESFEYLAIKKETGKEFCVLGLDVMNYSGTALEYGDGGGNSIEVAYDWSVNAGGIVQFCWHWHSPKGYIPEGKNWYSSFYTESSSVDIDSAMNGEDEELYNLLLEDIDRISEQLKRLQEYGVPVLWRPLHEASGGWFWWGSGSSESYIKLYRLMYDRMTNYHGLNNLIWVWNGQSKDWYPGDDVVDIISTDIYAGERVYSSQVSSFIECADSSGERKLVALSENGCIPDPDLMKRDNAVWLYFGVWSGSYTVMWDDAVYNEQYTDLEMLKKVYNSEHTLTLDELPDLKNYPF